MAFFLKENEVFYFNFETGESVVTSDMRAAELTLMYDPLAGLGSSLRRVSSFALQKREGKEVIASDRKDMERQRLIRPEFNCWIALLL